MASTAQKPKPKAMEIDPALAAIFSSMESFMGTEIVNMTCTRAVTGSGVNQTANLVDVNGNTANSTVFEAGPRVTVTPMNANLGPGGTQQFTATATNADGTPFAQPGATFHWTVNPGGLGTISASGLYTAPATISAGSMDSVKCSLDGTQSYTTVSVSLHP